MMRNNPTKPPTTKSPTNAPSRDLRAESSASLPALVEQGRDLIFSASRNSPVEASLALATARQMLGQPCAPRRLAKASNIFGMMMKWPSEDVIVDREVFLAGLVDAIRRRGFAEAVVDEALRRLRDQMRWMPAISDVIEACAAVQARWLAEIDGPEHAHQEQEKQRRHRIYNIEHNLRQNERERRRIEEAEQRMRADRTTDASDPLGWKARSISKMEKQLWDLDREREDLTHDLEDARRRQAEAG